MAVLWMLVWAPAYASTWGVANFLALCDVAVILTAVGLWRGSALLLSSQALPAIMAGLLWAIDVTARLVTGRHLFGGTEYMFSAQPLPVRLLSLFHLLLPVVLVAALRRTGYDRRGLALQVALMAPLLVASRLLTPPEKNLNFAWVDPLLHRQWGPVPLHLLAMLVGTTLVAYLPTHLLLARLLPARRSGSSMSGG
jgi:hypothetical protein